MDLQWDDDFSAAPVARAGAFFVLRQGRRVMRGSAAVQCRAGCAGRKCDDRTG